VADITLTQLRAHLRLPASTGEAGDPIDVALKPLVDGANAFVASATGRTWRVTDYTEVLRGHGSPMLSLPHYPIASVTSVVVDGETLDASAYDVDARNGILERIDGTPFEAGRGRTIAVTYKAGRLPPADLHLAALELAAFAYRASGGQMAVSADGVSVTLWKDAMGELPLVRDALARYADPARGYAGA
jgi:hypothetical protein